MKKPFLFPHQTPGLIQDSGGQNCLTKPCPWWTHWKITANVKPENRLSEWEFCGVFLFLLYIGWKVHTQITVFLRRVQWSSRTVNILLKCTCGKKNIFVSVTFAFYSGFNEMPHDALTLERKEHRPGHTARSKRLRLLYHYTCNTH